MKTRKNATITGAVILSVDITTLNKSDATSFTDPLFLSRALTRYHHTKQLIDQISVCNFDNWYGVYTTPCPSLTHKHPYERGLAMAHYNIWLDFVYFDPNIHNNHSSNRELTYSKVGENEFQNKNGLLYKNGMQFQENDIIMIVEDDADIAIVDINKILLDEFQDMNTDILFLGWCEGRNARPVPLCTHAYALTRSGARKLIYYYEPCGKAIDEQFVIMAKNNWISYRKVHSSSYKNNFNTNYPTSNDKTFGVFHQKNIGSLNGH